MMKLYRLTTNNGDWGGFSQTYVVADSKEQAISKDKSYQRAVERGDDHWVSEVSGEDLLESLTMDSSILREYTMEYVIKRKVEKPDESLEVLYEESEER